MSRKKTFTDLVIEEHAHTYIYALIDPRTGKIRYVGKSDNPKQRLAEHMSDWCYATHTHRSRWIASLRQEGLKPEIRILEQVPWKQWVEKEQEWIKRLREEGENLTNGTDGGEGTTGASEETRERMRSAQLGRYVSLATRDKLRKINLGKRASEETRRKQSLARKGRPKSAATRLRMSVASRGNKKCLGRKLSAETRRKIGEGQPSKRRKVDG